MYSEVLDDRKIKRIQRFVPQCNKMEIIGVWTSILCLANDSNNRGSLLIGSSPMTVDDLVDELGIKGGWVDMLIEAFETQSMIEKTNGVWRVSNWDKRQQGRKVYPSDAGFVYLMNRDDAKWTKIGLSIHPDKRQLQVAKECSNQVGYSVKIGLLKVWEVPNMIEAERQLHKLFDNKRVAGEWFNLDTDEIESIELYMSDFKGVPL